MKKDKKSKIKKQKRNFNQLTLGDRVKIEIRYRGGWSFRRIAEYLENGRTASSICREVDGTRQKFDFFILFKRGIIWRFFRSASENGLFINFNHLE